MTVKELINKLKEMPEDAGVEIEIIESTCHSFVGNVDEIFETISNTVVLQSIY